GPSTVKIVRSCERFSSLGMTEFSSHVHVARPEARPFKAAATKIYHIESLPFIVVALPAYTTLTRHQS
ncbi:MAG: hypothetical protein WB919_22355, partial [Candidatus Sulfotelmatobacter sp.]